MLNGILFVMLVKDLFERLISYVVK